MNALTRDLADLVKIVEAKADGKDCFRQKPAFDATDRMAQ